MTYTEELSDFKCGALIGHHLYYKSVHEISALLDLPWATVNAVIVRAGLQSAEACCTFRSPILFFSTHYTVHIASGNNINVRTVQWEPYEIRS